MDVEAFERRNEVNKFSLSFCYSVKERFHFMRVSDEKQRPIPEERRSCLHPLVLGDKQFLVFHKYKHLSPEKNNLRKMKTFLLFEIVP